jgi:hypothetical protein
VGRSARMRGLNERIADTAERYGLRSRVPMHCECSDSGCDELILIDLGHYNDEHKDGGYLTVTDHTADPTTAAGHLHTAT